MTELGAGGRYTLTVSVREIITTGNNDSPHRKITFDTANTISLTDKSDLSRTKDSLAVSI